MKQKYGLTDLHMGDKLNKVAVSGRLKALFKVQINAKHLERSSLS